MSDPTIDFTQLPFPSDHLTVAELRKVYPRSFDLPSRLGTSSFEPPRAYGRNSIEDTLGGTLDSERVLASLVFKQLLGLRLTEEAQHSRESLFELLADEYVTLGLAAGVHHAEQLVREIESRAAAQAQSHHGRPR